MGLAPASVRHLPFTTDSGLGARACIGLIVLASDQTIEHEFRLMLNLPGVAVYESRIHNDNDITPATLRAMEGGIAPATRLILPGMPLDVVGFGCTSAAMVLGEATIGARIREARPGIAFTTPVTGAFAALSALAATRIAVLTPYSDEVNAGIRTYIEQAGFTVAAMGSFNERDDRVVARIAPAAIADAAEQLVAGSGAEALFVSCTSLRLVETWRRWRRASGFPPPPATTRWAGTACGWPAWPTGGRSSDDFSRWPEAAQAAGGLRRARASRAGQSTT